jgi:hypothetical protein
MIASKAEILWATRVYELRRMLILVSLLIVSVIIVFISFLGYKFLSKFTISGLRLALPLTPLTWATTQRRFQCSRIIQNVIVWVRFYQCSFNCLYCRRDLKCFSWNICNFNFVNLSTFVIICWLLWILWKFALLMNDFDRLSMILVIMELLIIL